MNTFTESPLTWLVLGILVLGLLSAWFARVGAGSRRQALSHALFLGCLPMVAGATIVSFGVGPGCWLASAATFAVMVLGATADTRRSRGVSVL
ncbi:MAG: hypothetical protein ACOCWL_03710 [Thermoguttaceae bacterium]